MAILSMEASTLHASSASPEKGAPGASRLRGRAASVTDRKGYPRPSSRPCPMPLTDMLPGMGGEFAQSNVSSRHSPSESPAKTPLTRTVHSSMASLPGVACMHKLPLREFQEAEPSIYRSNSRSNSSTPMPTGRQRSNSCTSLRGYSSADTTRPNSISRSGAASGELSASSEGLRPLTHHERSQMNSDAVEWFRSSQLINNRCRSSEETEAILAAARERRSQGVKRHAKVEKVVDTEVESVTSEEPPAAAEPVVEEPQRRKSIIDPLLLWGAKAKFMETKSNAAKRESQKQEEVKKVQRSRSHSIGGEGVCVGQNPTAMSFLARLRRKASTIE